MTKFETFMLIHTWLNSIVVFLCVARLNSYPKPVAP